MSDQVQDEDAWPEWTAWVLRWDALIAGLRGRPGFDDASLDETHFDGCQEPFVGIARLLASHELGHVDLTPAEEDELWDLAAEEGLTDDELINESVRERSVRGRPVRRLVSPYVLRGGGHGAGRGLPGKREFPASWSDDDAVARTMDVARRPSGALALPSSDFRAWGERDGVLVAVLVSPEGEVLTSYPVSGDGVVQNPLSPEQQQPVARLAALVEQVAPGEVRDALEELMAVGEWPHVIASLRALPLPEQQQADLADLARLAS